MLIQMNILLDPWPWYIAGPVIAVILFLLLYFGKNFGMSNNLRTMCAIGGGGRASDFFAFDWRSQSWNLVFVAGAILGGFLTSTFLTGDAPIDLSQATVQKLEAMGFDDPGERILPPEIFGAEAVWSVKGLAILLVGGFLVGFGARYAGGCTSGHAISGISDLQIPSVIAVIGFFIGGLLMTHFILPLLF